MAARVPSLLETGGQHVRKVRLMMFALVAGLVCGRQPQRAEAAVSQQRPRQHLLLAPTLFSHKSCMWRGCWSSRPSPGWIASCFSRLDEPVSLRRSREPARYPVPVCERPARHLPAWPTRCWSPAETCRCPWARDPTAPRPRPR